MRIAYVINSMEGGGAALPVPAILAVLRDAGAEVSVLALERRDGRAAAPIAAAGFPLAVREGGRRDHLAALRWLDREVARVRPTHLWTSLSRATLLGQIVGARRRLPVASWQHAAWLKPANRRLLRATRRLSALWIADSDATAAYARDTLGVADARLMRWPIFRADPAAPQAAPWQPGERVRIGSLGRLHPVKGYDVLADALAMLPGPVGATIAGEGTARATLEGRGLALPGYAADPAALLAGLHLYVQPSRSEGFCIAAHEAMLAGLPVIASAVGQMAHTLADGAGGMLVPPGDAAALARALAAMLADPARLAAISAAGREAVLDRFSPARFEDAGRTIVARLRHL